MVGYVSHFIFGGAVATPDMCAAYVARILPLIVISLLITYNKELRLLMKAAEF